MSKLENFLIPLEEIKSATNDFDKANYIGGGGFGYVYKGKLADFRTSNLCAIKRLDPKSRQGLTEFEKEVDVLYRCNHKNLVTFIGYCNEGGEMIIVYDYATNRSLDRHLHDPNEMRRMSWLRRLSICIGTARGLDYLHCGLGPDHQVIHRDVKSSNILLDENWEAKVSDFGLSKVSKRDQPYATIDTRVAGTDGYCDPYYREADILTKESDVYSLGVVLFEMLSGRLVHPNRMIYPKSTLYTSDDDSRTLLQLVWRYKENLDKIIDPHIRDGIDPKSLRTFKEIALQCIETDYTKRPTMTRVHERLEEALGCQLKKELEIHESRKQKLVHDSEQHHDELDPLLSKGILFDEGNKWICLSKLNGKKCLHISAMEFLEENDHVQNSSPQSRFKKVAEFGRARDFTHLMQIDTRMLSSETAYAVLLICRGGLMFFSGTNLCNNYGTKEISKLGSPERRDDVWMEIELFKFINHRESATMEFRIEWDWKKAHHKDGEGSSFWVEGIECRPIDMEKHEHRKQAEKDELHSLLSDGVLIDKGTKWFSLSRLNGKNSLIISGTEVFKESYGGNIISQSSTPKSRFKEVVKFEDGNNDVSIRRRIHITTEMLSLETTYAVFIISTCQLIAGEVSVTIKGGENVLTTSTIETRDDGWMELELFHFTNNHVKVATFEFEINRPPVDQGRESWGQKLIKKGLLKLLTKLEGGTYLEGIEFRPIDIDIDVDVNTEEESQLEEHPELDCDDGNWEQKLKLPSDYQEIVVERASDTKGIFMDNGSMWFCLDKSTGKKCIMLSPNKLIVQGDAKSASIKDESSRFSWAMEWRNAYLLKVKGKMKAEMLSDKTQYAAWLVFKISFYGRGLVTTASLTLGKQERQTRRVYLTPTSKRIELQNHDVESRHQVSSKKRLDRRPWERNDGWMEVELFQFLNDIEVEAGDNTEIEIGLRATCDRDRLGLNLLGQGIEFRPKN